MDSRMKRYKEEEQELIPTRSDKNQNLYKQIYNAYDSFENLVVPSNAREIDLKDLKKEVTSREDYHKVKDYGDITNTNNTVKRKEQVIEQQKEENQIYDINELLTKAVSEKKGPELIEPTLANKDYLKKLKLDKNKTNIEQVKEIYEDIKEESLEEDSSLLETANLSLEILSDLKSDNDATMVCPAIKEEELPEFVKEKESDFYSNTYKFSKKDFESQEYVETTSHDESDLLEEENGNRRFFFKILLLIFGISLVVIVIVYLFNYFNRV